MRRRDVASRKVGVVRALTCRTSFILIQFTGVRPSTAEIWPNSREQIPRTTVVNRFLPHVSARRLGIAVFPDTVFPSTQLSISKLKTAAFLGSGSRETSEAGNGIRISTNSATNITSRRWVSPALTCAARWARGKTVTPG